jgi:hypothetical protein
MTRGDYASTIGEQRYVSEPIETEYCVIHKSVKYFKNSQQIDYATDRGNSYTDRDRNSPIFLYIFLRCSMYPPLVIR